MTGVARAAVWSGPATGFTVVDVAWPELAAGEVLVEVELTTVCGSDRHTYAGDRSTPIPTVLGHEAIGRVVATGGEVLTVDGHRVRVGARVAWTIVASCGTCRRCRRGLPQKCATARKYGHEPITEHWRLNGTYASHVHLLAGTGIVELPEGLAAAVAAPAGCATATVVAAIRRTGLAAGDLAVVLGCGMLGLTAVAYLRRLEVGRIVACDLVPARRDRAVAFGADVVCSPSELADVVAAQSAGAGADLVLELTGSSAVAQSALALLAIDGRLGLVGSVFVDDPLTVPPESMVRNLWSIVGTHNYEPDDLAVAVDFLEQVDQALFASLVGVRSPLSMINDAFAAPVADGAVRVAIDPSS